MDGDSRIPQLDALRAIACVLVLIAHLDSIYGFPELPPEMGPVGVAIFFALSGYLITRGLIRSPIRLATFFNKRAARILPAYFLLLGVLSLVWYSHEILWCATFTFNFLFMSAARDYFHVPLEARPSPPVGHLWSICVEEHFYWVWPLILLVCSRRWAGALVMLVIAATPAIAWVIVQALDARGTHPDAFAGIVSRITLTQLTAIGLGSLIALNEAWLLRSVKLFGLRVPVVALLGLMAVATTWQTRQAFRGGVWGTPEQQLCMQPTLIHFFGAGVMAVGITIDRLGRIPWLGYLGRISYGLYLYHLPIYVLFGLAQSGHSPIWLVSIPALLSTFGVAALSYRYLETPLIRWGRQSSATSPFWNRSYGLVAALLFCLLFSLTLISHMRQPPLSSLLALTKSIPIEERRVAIQPAGTAVTAYRWLGVEHHIDSQGYRRTKPIPPKRDTVSRIITVGDSLTWGACVAENKTYSAILEKLLIQAGMSVEVINGGKAGGQAEDVVQTLEQELLAYQPDRIIYAATLTDFLTSNTGWEGHSVDEWMQSENQDRFIRAIKAMKELCQSRQIDFHIFAFVADPSDPALARTARLIEQLARDDGISVISVEDYLTRYQDQDFRIYVPFDDHPTEQCHHLHAEIIARALTSARTSNQRNAVRPP